MITLPQTIAAFCIAIVVSLVTGYGFGHKRGADGVRLEVKAEYADQLAKAQDETATLQARANTAEASYAVAQTALAASRASNSALLARMRNKAPTAASLSDYSSAALAGGLADAEGDIDRCAGSVERFGDEAAREAAKVGRLKSAWPSPEATRKARESRTMN